MAENPDNGGVGNPSLTPPPGSGPGPLEVVLETQSDTAMGTSNESKRVLEQAIKGEKGLDVHDANEYEERDYVTYTGQVYTAPGGGIEVSDEVRSQLALLDQGRIIYLRGSDIRWAVSLIRNDARRKGIEISQVIGVRGKTLQTVYANYAEKSKSSVTAHVDRTEAEKKLRDIVKKFAEQRASDIHFQLSPMGLHYMGRVDGILGDPEAVSVGLGDALFYVAYYLSDDTEGGLPKPDEHQSGRITGRRFDLPSGVQSIRLQFSPLAGGGRYLVMRLFYASSHGQGEDVDNLGYSRFQVDGIRSLRRIPFGIILFAGVTGSGKSTTLHKSMQSLLREKGGAINVVTIEDPPEFVIDGARQIPVVHSGDDRAKGFSEAIKASLRLDPDVIMVGEIRDSASAELAVTASLTGHQVWSTVHAQSSVRAIERLIDEGVDQFRVLDSSVLAGLVAQRLLQKLCANCSLNWEEGKKEGRFDKIPGFSEEFAEKFVEYPKFLTDEGVRVCNPRTPLAGCGEKGCRSGYSGRTVIAEVLLPDAAFMDAYKEGRVMGAEEHWLNEMNGIRMSEHGFMKMVAGMFDPFDLHTAVGVLGIKVDRIPMLLGMATAEGLIEENYGQ